MCAIFRYGNASFNLEPCLSAPGALGRRLRRPLGRKRRFLRSSQPGRASGVHPLVGSLGLEGGETFAGLDVPVSDDRVACTVVQVNVQGQSNQNRVC